MMLRARPPPCGPPPVQTAGVDGFPLDGPGRPPRTTDRWFRLTTASYPSLCERPDCCLRNVATAAIGRSRVLPCSHEQRCVLDTDLSL
jgi:hypothetical protein